MKLHLQMLERLITLQSQEPKDLRALFDDLIGDVKDIDTSGSHPVFTVETLANRGDHLSALGIARELSARSLTPVKIPSSVSELPNKPVSLVVRNETDKCSRYAAMEMALSDDLAIPSEIKSIVGSAEDRPAIVDFLNYIQLEIGQPMHAFDFDKVEGEVVVRISDKEEEVIALDQKGYKVPSGSVVICDRRKVIAVAGVIGCANTMVSSTTKKVLIESAAFDPISVRLTARKMGLSTDASYVFERGSDREAILYSLKRLAFLTKGSGGSVAGTGAHVLGLTVLAGKPTEERKITTSLKRLRRELNLPRLSLAEVKSRFQHLGFKLAENEEELVCSVPSWRLWDVHNQDDLIEEIARVHGYNNLKIELPALDYEQAEASPLDNLLEIVEPIIHGNGFFEVITDSFASPDDLKILEELQSDVESEHVKIVNAVEGACAFVKNSNVLSLGKVAEYNLKRGVPSVKVYELGKLFGLSGVNAVKGGEDQQGNLYEREVLSFAVAGRWHDTEFRKGEGIEELLFNTKGVIQAIADGLGSELSVGESEHKYLHPGRQASLKFGRLVAGVFGVVHPGIAKKLGLKHDLVYAELDTQTLEKVMKPRQFVEPSEFPSIRRDLTLRLEPRSLSEKVLSYLRELKFDDLSTAEIVDDFRREGEGYRRVSYRLTFQRKDRTLESSEVDDRIGKILQHLKERHGLELAV